MKLKRRFLTALLGGLVFATSVVPHTTVYAADTSVVQVDDGRIEVVGINSQQEIYSEQEVRVRVTDMFGTYDAPASSIKIKILEGNDIVSLQGFNTLKFTGEGIVSMQVSVTGNDNIKTITMQVSNSTIESIEDSRIETSPIIPNSSKGEVVLILPESKDGDTIKVFDKTNTEVYSGTKTVVKIPNLKDNTNHTFTVKVFGADNTEKESKTLSIKTDNATAPTIDEITYSPTENTIRVLGSSAVEYEGLNNSVFYSINNSDFTHETIFGDIATEDTVNLTIKDVDGNYLSKRFTANDYNVGEVKSIRVELDKQDADLDYFDLSKVRVFATIQTGNATIENEVSENIFFEPARGYEEIISIDGDRVVFIGETAETQIDAKVLVTYSNRGSEKSTVFDVKYISNGEETPTPKPDVVTLKVEEDKQEPNLEYYDLSKLSVLKVVNADGTITETDVTDQVTFKPVEGYADIISIENNKVYFIGETTETKVDGRVLITYLNNGKEVSTIHKISYIGEKGEKPDGGDTENGIYEIFNTDMKEKYILKVGQSFDIGGLNFQVIYKNGTRKIVNALKMDVSLDVKDMKYAELRGGRIFSFTGYAEAGKQIPVTLTYEDQNGATAQVEVRFVLENDKTDGDNNNDNDNEDDNKDKVLKSLEVEGDDSFEIEEDDSFDLEDLSFVVEYKNGDDKEIDFKDIEEVNIPSKYKNIVDIDRKNNLEFTRKADIGDEVDIEFVYKEGENKVKTTVSFELVKEGQSTYGKKPVEIVVNSGEDNVIKVGKSESYNLDKMDLTIVYENGAKKDIKGSALKEDGFVIKKDDRKKVTIDKSNKLSFDKKSEIGEEAVVTVYFESGKYTLKTDVTFELVRGENVVLKDLVADYPVYNIAEGETLDLKDIVFYVHYSTSDKEKLSVPDVDYQLQYKYRNLIDLNHGSHTLKFNPEIAKYGDHIIIEFFYRVDNQIKVEPVRFVYTESKDGAIGSEKPSPTSFSDIKGHWAEKDILELAKKNMVVGYDKDKYFPNQMVTRGEVAGFISKFLGLKTQAEVPNPFTDVRADYWYYDDIARVYEAGVFKGYEDGKFKPASNISREELAVILVRTYKHKYGIKDISNNTPDFADQKSISNWAEQSVMEAKAMSLISGRPNNLFDPKANTTRAEMSALLWRMLNNK